MLLILSMLALLLVFSPSFSNIFMRVVEALVNVIATYIKVLLVLVGIILLVKGYTM